MMHLGRKLFHLLGGLGLLCLYFLVGRNTAFLLYGILLLVVLLFEVARLTIPAFNEFFFARFGTFVRMREKRKLTGTVPYILGAGLSLYAYSTNVASAAICFLAFGDVAATTIGERYGRTKIGDKSLEGAFAFLTAALAAGMLLSLFGLHLPPWVAVLGALAATGIELLPLRVNDNFMIPLLSGAIMELALRWVR